VGNRTNSTSKHITLTRAGEVTDAWSPATSPKYATKSTEVTGHTSTWIHAETASLFADPDGDHIARLIDACWRLGRPLDQAQTPTAKQPCSGRRPCWDRADVSRLRHRHPTEGLPGLRAEL